MVSQNQANEIEKTWESLFRSLAVKPVTLVRAFLLESALIMGVITHSCNISEQPVALDSTMEIKPNE